ncbi:unnamed protein product [Protopolystoma xenopodis]|uniref:Uncharacterized protein n=1 Tax=Protopolystoma xenopodis TaxID=117903 RepID=A0A3S4ZVD2_9PLAT|nr:unnamed protein product [Protopolystoma xenopodis]
MTVRDQTCSSHLSGASTPSGPSPDKSSCSPAVPQASCLSAFFLGCCYLVPPSAGPPSPSKTPSLPSQSSSSSTPTAELGKAPSESLTGVSPSLTVTSTLSTLPKSDSSDSSQPHLETGSNHATEEAGVEGPSTPTFTDIHLALRIYTHRPAGSLICFDGM